MQGAFINQERPKTKKAFREAVADAPESVSLEATSFFGNEYDGPITAMPDGKRAFIVGPDPMRQRNWYANITRTGDTFEVE